MSKMIFWLTLDGKNVDLSGIEKTLQIKLIDNRIEAPETIVSNKNDPVFYEQIAWLLDLAEKNKSMFEKYGVVFSESQIWMIYLYEKQCNLEFDADLLERIGRLGLKLCISCDEVLS